jgi:putative heme-binding domain-containing protein
VIETPLSLPEDIKKQLDLESRGRGRIWRIAPTVSKPGKLPDLSKHTPNQLADELVNPNPWRRLTAQRLIVERLEKTAVDRVRELVAGAKGKPGRVNLLWTLQALGALTEKDVAAALVDPEPGVRENALRLAQPFAPGSSPFLRKVQDLHLDQNPRVRFQLAVTAGAFPASDAALTLAKVLSHPGADHWTVTAALSSAKNCCQPLLADLATADQQPTPETVTRVAALLGAMGDGDQIARAIRFLTSNRCRPGVDVAILDGLGQGMRNGKVPLAMWLANPPKGSEAAVTALRDRFTKAATLMTDEKVTAAERAGAAKMLGYATFDVAGPALAGALTPVTPVDVQLAAVRALAAHADPKVSEHFLTNWKGYGPTVRAAVLDALLARVDRTLALLAAVEKKDVPAAAVSPSQVQQLKAHPNATVKARAGEVFKQAVDADRAKVVASYSAVLELKGDAAVGKALFAKHCSACHKLEGVGHDVGPNLLAVIGNKSGSDLLVSVFDPNREVDPRYLTYQVGTADERVLIGIVVNESPTSVTVRRAEGAEDVILRTNLSLFRATALSLMPVGLEKELKPQDVSNLFAYLRSAGK